MPPSPARGPSVTVPLAYLAAASLAFALAAMAVPWLAPELAGHYYQPRILALAHSVTLGWITLSIMGASYQIVPIVLDRRLWSERLAWWQFALMLVGVIGMVGHFWLGSWPGLVWAAGIVALAVAAHVLNVALTIRGIARWTFTARLVVLALGGLVLTTLAGFILGLDKLRGDLPGDLFASLHAHVHLAVLGWVLPMVAGVAARVYPMFLLAREPDGWPERLQLWGLALGVPATVIGIATDHWLLLPGALAVAAVVTGHLVWIAGMLRSRKRPALDVGIRLAVVGAAALIPATALGLALASGLVGGPRVAAAYMTLVLGGWASLTIAGMLLKIVPFLVWYRAYAGRVGREPVPALADLSWYAGERMAALLLTLGVAALAVAVWLGDVTAIRAAGAVLAAGALSLTATLVRILRHLRTPARPAAAASPAMRSI